MYFRSKRFKKHAYTTLAIILAFCLVVPIAAMFTGQKQDPQLTEQQTLAQNQTELINYLNNNPDDMDALTELGITYMYQDNLETALGIFEDVLANEPNHEGARYNLASANFSQGDYDRAIENADVIIKNNPAYSQAYMLKGYAYGIGKNDYAAGIKALEDYLAVVDSGQEADMARVFIESWTSELAGNQ
jgi:tetratricopeptide (TPR) repeat protein